MDLSLVIRLVIRRYWPAEDPRQQYYYLIDIDGVNVWSDDPAKAWLYSSMVAFTDAHEHQGKVFLRLPLGREVPVEESDFRTPIATEVQR